MNLGLRQKLNLLQTSVNDHWHCILSNTRQSGDSLADGTRNEDIDLESGEYVPVGHIWKFDFEQREKHDFGMKYNFFKNSNWACHAQLSRDN